MKFCADIPYPEIKVEKQNPLYAKLILNEYAGQYSELSTICLYIFEHITTSTIYKEYSSILRSIAIVEMHHLQMLGQLISLLGVKPVFMSYNNDKKVLIPWKSSYLNYNTDIKDIVELDIKAEEETIKKYNHILSIVKDKYIVAIIERIIMDEQIHLEIFKEFKSNLEIA